MLLLLLLLLLSLLSLLLIVLLLLQSESLVLLLRGQSPVSVIIMLGFTVIKSRKILETGTFVTWLLLSAKH